MAKKDEKTTVSQESLSLFNVDTTPKTGPQNRKEELYDKIKIPVKALDAIIVVLVVAIVVCVVLGIRAGR